MLTADEKLSRKMARLALRGPVIAQIASASEPDKTYDVRYRSGDGYWCSCIGFQIRKRCRHVDYCKVRGWTQPQTSVVPEGRSVTTPATKVARTTFPERDTAAEILHAVLRAGGVYANELQTDRMTTKLRILLADRTPARVVPEYAAPSDLGIGHSVRKIILEDDD